jgi:hypothetical protein
MVFGAGNDQAAWMGYHVRLLVGGFNRAIDNLNQSNR